MWGLELMLEHSLVQLPELIEAGVALHMHSGGKYRKQLSRAQHAEWHECEQGKRCFKPV